MEPEEKQPTPETLAAVPPQPRTTRRIAVRVALAGALIGTSVGFGWALSQPKPAAADVTPASAAAPAKAPSSGCPMEGAQGAGHEGCPQSHAAKQHGCCPGE